MSFANHNILDIALSLIPPTLVQIRKNLGTQVNKYGQSEATYGEWIEVYGIVQPGSEQNEHTEGVDFSKKHVTIWLRGVALDGTHIQWAPDQIRYVGKIFNVIGVKDWFPYDNYRECECVEVMNLDESQRGRFVSTLQKSNQQRKRGKTKQQVELQSSVQSCLVRSDGTKDMSEAITNCSESAVDDENQSSLKTSLVGKAMIRF